MICKSALNPWGAFHCMTPGEGEDKSDTFQPLYQSLAGAAPPAATEADQQAALIEEARLNGFQEGLKSGQVEARTLLRSSLLPGLNSFQNSCSNLTVLDEKIQVHASTNITELAIAIAERILNAPISLDLECRHAAIQTVLKEANRLSMSVHPNDLQLLRTILSESGLEWTAQMDLLIQANDAVQAGEVRAQDYTGLRSLFEQKIMQDLSEVLA
jgi:flagellar biosynthesis/type III secretory pathway protein FliH